VELLARLLVAAVLAFAALVKLRAPAASADGMAAFGFRTLQGRWLAFLVAVLVELGLAIAIVADSERALYAAAGLMALYALTMVAALLRERAGEPCGCFGAGSRVSWRAAGRNAALAAGFAAVAVLAA
jgi:hypothetical protein